MSGYRSKGGSKEGGDNDLITTSNQPSSEPQVINIESDDAVSVSSSDSVVVVDEVYNYIPDCNLTTISSDEEDVHVVHEAAFSPPGVTANCDNGNLSVLKNIKEELLLTSQDDDCEVCDQLLDISYIDKKEGCDEELSAEFETLDLTAKPEMKVINIQDSDDDDIMILDEDERFRVYNQDDVEVTTVSSDDKKEESVCQSKPADCVRNSPPPQENHSCDTEVIVNSDIKEEEPVKSSPSQENPSLCGTEDLECCDGYASSTASTCLCQDENSDNIHVTTTDVSPSNVHDVSLSLPIVESQENVLRSSASSLEEEEAVVDNDKGNYHVNDVASEQSTSQVPDADSTCTPTIPEQMDTDAAEETSNSKPPHCSATRVIYYPKPDFSMLSKEEKKKLYAVLTARLKEIAPQCNFKNYKRIYPPPPPETPLPKVAIEKNDDGTFTRVFFRPAAFRVSDQVAVDAGKVPWKMPLRPTPSFLEAVGGNLPPGSIPDRLYLCTTPPHLRGTNAEPKPSTSKDTCKQQQQKETNAQRIKSLIRPSTKMDSVSFQNLSKNQKTKICKVSASLVLEASTKLTQRLQELKKKEAREKQERRDQAIAAANREENERKMTRLSGGYIQRKNYSEVLSTPISSQCTDSIQRRPDRPTCRNLFGDPSDASASSMTSNAGTTLFGKSLVDTFCMSPSPNGSEVTKEPELSEKVAMACGYSGGDTVLVHDEKKRSLLTSSSPVTPSTNKRKKRTLSQSSSPSRQVIDANVQAPYRDRYGKPVCPLPNSAGWEGDDLWQVERVNTAKIEQNPDGNDKNMYNVKWRGWEEVHNSWVEEEDFESRAPVVTFWRRFLNRNCKLNKPIERNMVPPVDDSPETTYSFKYD